MVKIVLVVLIFYGSSLIPVMIDNLSCIIHGKKNRMVNFLPIMLKAFTKLEPNRDSSIKKGCTETRRYLECINIKESKVKEK